MARIEIRLYDTPLSVYADFIEGEKEGEFTPPRPDTLDIYKITAIDSDIDISQLFSTQLWREIEDATYEAYF